MNNSKNLSTVIECSQDQRAYNNDACYMWRGDQLWYLVDEIWIWQIYLGT